MESYADFVKKREKIAKSDICYFDKKGKIVDKEKGVTFIITEYDKDGNVINTIYGRCQKKKRRKDNE